MLFAKNVAPKKTCTFSQVVERGLASISEPCNMSNQAVNPKDVLKELSEDEQKGVKKPTLEELLQALEQGRQTKDKLELLFRSAQRPRSRVFFRS